MSPIAANAAASITYSSGRIRRSGSWSTRAVSSGASSAGRNFAAMKIAAVGATASVRS